MLILGSIASDREASSPSPDLAFAFDPRTFLVSSNRFHKEAHFVVCCCLLCVRWLGRMKGVPMLLILNKLHLKAVREQARPSLQVWGLGASGASIRWVRGCMSQLQCEGIITFSTRDHLECRVPVNIHECRMPVDIQCTLNLESQAYMQQAHRHTESNDHISHICESIQPACSGSTRRSDLASLLGFNNQHQLSG